MDKSLEEIISSSRPATDRKESSPKGVGKGKRTRRPRSSGSRPATGQQRGFKTVVVRNLSDAISEDDIRDLFRQVGPVVRVHVERDDRGDRTGMAWVLFDFAEDALVAAERFHQRKAAGQTISVRRVAHIGDTGAGSASLGGRIGASAGSGSGPGSAKPRSRRSAKDKKSKQPPKSRNAADLDAELDAYMQVDSAVPEGSSSTGPSSAGQTQSQPEESMIDV